MKYVCKRPRATLVDSFMILDYENELIVSFLALPLALFKKCNFLIFIKIYHRSATSTNAPYRIEVKVYHMSARSSNDSSTALLQKILPGLNANSKCYSGPIGPVTSRIYWACKIFFYIARKNIA